jgi:hypothetical protein
VDAVTTIEVVSSYLPTGTSWLLNCFLELGVGCSPGANHADYWLPAAEDTYRLRPEHLGLSRFWPSLQTERAFAFPHGIWARLGHEWPAARHDAAKIIFYARDPRDALYSQYRRLSADRSFADFLHDPFDPLPFSNLYYCVLFCGVWRRFLVGRPHLVIRFEDTKRDPERELRRALDFIGVSATPGQVRQALEASSFEATRKAETAYTGAVAEHERFVVNRAGIPFEYERHFTPDMHDAIGPVCDAICEWLDYPPYAEARRSSVARGAYSPAELEYAASCLGAAPGQAPLSAETPRLLEQAMNEDARRDALWAVVGGQEVSRLSAAPDFAFARWQRAALALWQQAQSDPARREALGNLARALAGLAPSQRAQEHFIHRWMVLTGEYIGPG